MIRSTQLANVGQSNDGWTASQVERLGRAFGLPNQAAHGAHGGQILGLQHGGDANRVGAAVFMREFGLVHAAGDQQRVDRGARRTEDVGLQAIANRDLIVVRDVVMLLAAMVIVINFAIDLLYAWIDPRLKKNGAEA